MPSHKIVDHGHVMPLVEEPQGCVGADVAGAAGHECAHGWSLGGSNSEGTVYRQIMRAPRKVLASIGGFGFAVHQRAGAPKRPMGRFEAECFETEGPLTPLGR